MGECCQSVVREREDVDRVQAQGSVVCEDAIPSGKGEMLDIVLFDQYRLCMVLECTVRYSFHDTHLLSMHTWGHITLGECL